jgi:hypothetical protein
MWQFKKKVVSQLHRVPKLPERDAKYPWDHYVNEWLAKATIEHQPPEASTRELHKQEIASLLDNLAEGETPDDLERGNVLRIDNRLVFKTRTVLRALRDSLGDLASHELCDLLRDLGCRSERLSLGGARMRVWVAPERWPLDEDPPPATPEPAPSPSDRPAATPPSAPESSPSASAPVPATSPATQAVLELASNPPSATSAPAWVTTPPAPSAPTIRESSKPRANPSPAGSPAPSTSDPMLSTPGSVPLTDQMPVTSRLASSPLDGPSAASDAASLTSGPAPDTLPVAFVLATSSVTFDQVLTRSPALPAKRTPTSPATSLAAPATPTSTSGRASATAKGVSC